MKGTFLLPDLCIIRGIRNVRDLVQSMCSNRCGIIPVCFFEFELFPICGCDISIRERCFWKCLPESPPQDIHHCRIPVTSFALLMIHHPAIQDSARFMGGICVTLITYGDQSLRIVRSSFAAKINVMHHQFDCCSIIPFGAGFFLAALAFVSIPCKDICFQVLIFIHRSLLVHFSTDLWIFHMLHIKSSDLNPNTGTLRQCRLISGDDPDMMVQLGLDGWREPSFRSCGIERVDFFLPMRLVSVLSDRTLYINAFCTWFEFRMTVAHLAVSSPTSKRLSGFQQSTLFHAGTERVFFLAENLFCFLINDCASDMLGTGIDPEYHFFRMRAACFVIQSNGEGCPECDLCFPAFQQDTRLPGRGRSEPDPVQSNDVYLHSILSVGTRLPHSSYDVIDPRQCPGA